MLANDIFYFGYVCTFSKLTQTCCCCSLAVTDDNGVEHKFGLKVIILQF